MFSLLLLLFLVNPQQDYSDKNYSIVFHKIDNLVEVVVNDSIVFDSGVVDHNPDIDGGIRFDLSKYLTDKKDKVTVRLYNGHPPYDENEIDKSWSIEYEILKDDEEFDFFWDLDDNYEIGVVLEETYYL